MFKTFRSVCAALLFALAMVPQAFADPSVPPGCDDDGDPGCLYSTSLLAENTLVELPLSLPDPARSGYRVRMLIRFSTATLAEAAPIVIFNHGGKPRFGGQGANSEVGKLLARAGYVVIHPARTPAPSANGFRGKCIKNGVAGGSVQAFNANCRNFIGHAFYGPANVDFIMKPSVLNAIELAVENAGLDGTIDKESIGIAGHSAGTSIVLSKAGALRRFKPGGPLYNQKSAVPKAFMAMAPFGPDNGGFYYSPTWNYGGFSGKTFGLIDDRPLLSITGKGDEGPNVGDTGEEVIAEARTFAFRQAQQDSKFLSWNTEDNADHGTMALGNCAGELILYCAAYGDLAIAFFDAFLKDKQTAKDWLESDAHEVFTGGDAELHRR